MTHEIDDTETIPHAASPEQRLFMAVIAEAALDAIGQPRCYDPPHRRASECSGALSWFWEAGDDFHAVCDLAGLDPSHTRSAVLDFVAHGRAASLRRSPPSRLSNRTAKPSLIDVAAASGLSRETVRRVVAGDPTVSPDKRQRITRAIHETGYVHIPRKRAA